MRIGLLLTLISLGCGDGGNVSEIPDNAQNLQEAARLRSQGSLFLQQGRPARALEALAQAVRLDSSASPAHFNKGLAHVRLQDHPAAIASFERAIAIEPKNPRFLFALAAALRSQHRYLEAGIFFEQAIAQQPDHAEYHFNLGEVRRATSDFANQPNKQLDQGRGRTHRSFKHHRQW